MRTGTGWVRVKGGAFDGQTKSVSSLARSYGCGKEKIRKCLRGRLFSHVLYAQLPGRRRTAYKVIGGDIDGESMTAREIADYMKVSIQWVYLRVSDGFFLYQEPDRGQQERAKNNGRELGQYRSGEFSDGAVVRAAGWGFKGDHHAHG